MFARARLPTVGIRAHKRRSDKPMINISMCSIYDRYRSKRNIAMSEIAVSPLLTGHKGPTNADGVYSDA